MDMQNMLYFISVCNYRNITKAAEVMHISQSSLSRRIIAIEEEVGIQLLDRSGGYIELTPAGKCFLEEAERLLRKQEQMLKKLDRFKNVNAVTIGFSAGWHMRLLMDYLEKLKDCNVQDLYFDFSEIPVLNGVDELKKGNVDILFTFLGEVEDVFGLECKTLVRNNLSVMIPKGHRLWNKSSVTVEELYGERICISSEGHTCVQTWQRTMAVLRSLGFDHDRMEQVVYRNSLSELVLYVCIEKCLGLLGMISSFDMSLYPDKMKNIPLDAPNIRYGDMVAAYRRNDEHIKELVDMISE